MRRTPFAASATGQVFDRADAIGSYWGNPRNRTFAELLIDCEDELTLRAVLVGMLREPERGG